MIVYPDGKIETGEWLTADTYPDKEYFVIDEDSELATKITDLHPYYTLNVVNGVLVDVQPREKTPEEISAEIPPPPVPDRITELEQTVASLTQILTEKGITP